DTPIILNLFLSCTLEFLSFRVTPHIHLIIIFSVLSRRCKSSNFIGHVSLPYIITLWTHALYSLPLTFSDTPLEVRSGDSSLNLLQAHRTLALDASSAPPPAPIMSPQVTKLVNVFQIANIFYHHLTLLFSSLYPLNTAFTPEVTSSSI